MSIEFDYDPERGLIVTRFSGPLQLSELKEYFQQITSGDDFPPDADALVDFRNADFSAANRSLADQIVRLRSKFPQRASAKVAYLVGDELAFGMSRMYQILAEDMHPFSQVFRDEDEALNWLTTPN